MHQPALKEPCACEAQQVAGALGTDLQLGLSAQEAARRLARDGPNALRAAPPPPAWRRVLAQFQDPLTYLLLGAVAIALGAWVMEGGGGRGWPVDAIQEASLTGESEAVLKDAAALLPADAALGDRVNMVFKGTAVVQGAGRAIVTATGMASQVGAIAQMLEATVEAPTPLQRELARIGRALGIAVIVIVLVVVAAILLVSDIRTAADVIAVLLLGVSLAVAAVPEGLTAILSVVLALGVQRMAARKAIVKRLSSVETLGSASVICSDKTGTLTRSEMTIQWVTTASGGTRVTGAGYAPEGRFEHQGQPLAVGPVLQENIVVLGGGSLASNADLYEDELGRWRIQGDPTEVAFLVAERKLGTTERRERRFERVAQIPFTSERKLMSSIEGDAEHGGERVVVTKGAPDVLLGRCTRVRVGLAVLPLDNEMRARALADVDRLSDAALRTLAVGYRPLAPEEGTEDAAILERNLIFVGTVGIIDPPRAEAAVAIREARRRGWPRCTSCASWMRCRRTATRSP